MTFIQFAGYLAHKLLVNADYLVSLYSSSEITFFVSKSVD
jgi:hypothetical protein